MFDKELSGNRNISCATCHHPTLATGDLLNLSIGQGGTGLGVNRTLDRGAFTPRHAPPVFHKGLSLWERMTWDGGVQRRSDGRFSSPVGLLPPGLDSAISAQAMLPVTSIVEMRGRSGDRDVFGQPNELGALSANPGAIWDAIMDRLRAIPEYMVMFSAAFPGVAPQDLEFVHAANALGAFQRAAFSGLDTPFDRYVAGDRAALTNEQKRGGILFYGKANCFSCHSGSLLSDQQGHNIGVPQIGPGVGATAPMDFGMELMTRNANDRFKFLTPSLRNVELTAPYMHSGAYSTLERAVRHHLNAASSLRNYDSSQIDPRLRSQVHNEPNRQDEILATLSPAMQTPVDLTPQELSDLLAFLNALTDPDARDLTRFTPSRVPSNLPVTD